MSSFIAFSCLITTLCLQQAEALLDVEPTMHVSYVMKEIARTMVQLGLTDKTPKEIQSEMSLDFHSLPCDAETDPKMEAKIMLKSLACELLPDRTRETAETFHPTDHTKYDLKKYNNGIVALGVENFMVAAAQFCEDEAAGGKIEIVSVGSGDGTIEREIMAEYRARFHKDLPRIKLVDPDPKFHRIVDFRTVDHMIEERPSVVGNCVAFIIWPLPDDDGEEEEECLEPYDIKAIRILQPKAVFIVYECTGGSGSSALSSFLRDEKLERLSPREFGVQNWMSQCDSEGMKISGLDHYSTTEIAHQNLWFELSGTRIMRMVKVTRK